MYHTLDMMGMVTLTFEVPEELAREAEKATNTQEQAEEFVTDRVDAVRLVLPE